MRTEITTHSCSYGDRSCGPADRWSGAKNVRPGQRIAFRRGDGAATMSRKLIKTTAINVAERTYTVRFYEVRTRRGTRRYSAEIILRRGDQVILDDDSVKKLESKIACLVPATVYSRMLVVKTPIGV